MRQNAEVAPEQIAAARVTLAMLWCAVVPAPDVFARPRFQWPESSGAQSATATARYLTTLAKPVKLHGHVLNSSIVELIEPAADNDPALCYLADMLPAGSPAALLILGGGRAVRAERNALEIACRDYRIHPVPAIAGSPPDDPLTLDLRLPISWLERVSYVVLLGQSQGNQTSMPLWSGAGWTLDDLDVV